MIEIKSIGGSVLFVAKTASDARSAVEEAVRTETNLRGANLSGAYLDGAHLNGAYLSGAYLDGAHLDGAYLDGAYLDGAHLDGAHLDGAYLSGAYLDGAHLDGAYLSGAYLSGANLDGAYLSGAHLDGAYLSGAYLSGANLDGAYLDGKRDAVIKCLEDARRLMNDNGAHWIQGALHRVLDNGENAYCSIGGIEATENEQEVTHLALAYLSSVVGDIAHFNDAEGRTWEEIVAAFTLAIASVKTAK